MSIGLRGNCTAMMPELGAGRGQRQRRLGKIEPGNAEAVMNQRLRLIALAGTPPAACERGAAPVRTALLPGRSGHRERRRRPSGTTDPITFRGPASSETDSPNPFLDYRLDVTFSQGERKMVVPGYYAADGNAAESSADAGNGWRVHFVPDEAGEWTWTASFRRVAAWQRPTHPWRPNRSHSTAPVGTLTIGPADADAPGFSSRAGCNTSAGAICSSPNRQVLSQERRRQPGEPVGVCRLRRHEADTSLWPAQARCPRGRSHVARRPRPQPAGGVNYLASKGVNSIYFLPMNVRGDGKDVWPWTDAREHFRFDCSKLDQWERFFTHLDRLGIALHVVLPSRRTTNYWMAASWGPSGGCSIASWWRGSRHHLAVVWNLGEENTNTDAQRKDFAEYLHRLDPYDNPVVMHTFPKQQQKVYEPLLGFPYLEGVSLQTNDTAAQTREWIARSAAAGRPWVVCLDEIGPADTGVKPDADDYNHDEVRREHLWPHFMSGGAGVEWLFGYKYAHDDIKLEDFRSRDHMWDLTRYAVEFFRAASAVCRDGRRATG